MSNFKKVLVGVAFAAATTLGGTAANAAVTIHSYAGYQAALNPGETLVADFDAPFPGLGSMPAGWGYSGDASLLTGTSGLGAAPAFGANNPGDDDTTTYLSVQAGQVASFTSPYVSRLSFYIGSLDDYNSITFHFKGGGSQVIDGFALGAISGANDGDRQQIDTNGRFTFYSDTAIVGFDLNSTTNSFEVSNIGSAVPEPATWAMMIIGFGGVGSMVRSARRKQSVSFA